MNSDRETSEEIISKMKKFISLRDRCESEIIQYMKKKRWNEDIIPDVVETLKNEKIIDDERFARNRIESRMNRGYGPLYIKNELKILKIAHDTIAECFETISDDDFLDGAVDILERKLPGLMTRENTEEKLYSALKYRGFTDQQFRRAVKIIKNKYPHWAKRISGRDFEN